MQRKAKAKKTGRTSKKTAQKRKISQPKKALTAAASKRAGATAKPAKAKAKKTGGKAKASKSDGPGHPRYLVVDAKGSGVCTTKELNHHLRTKAKLSLIRIVDCERMLVMTQNGAWAKLQDAAEVVESAETAKLLSDAAQAKEVVPPSAPISTLQAPPAGASALPLAASEDEEEATPRSVGGRSPDAPPASFGEPQGHDIAQQSFADRELGG